MKNLKGCLLTIVVVLVVGFIYVSSKIADTADWISDWWDRLKERFNEGTYVLGGVALLACLGLLGNEIYKRHRDSRRPPNIRLFRPPRTDAEWGFEPATEQHRRPLPTCRNCNTPNMEWGVLKRLSAYPEDGGGSFVQPMIDRKRTLYQCKNVECGKWFEEVRDDD